jgi:hypothetical protein
MRTFSVIVFVLLAPFALAGADPPAGWIKAGSHPAEYDVGVDTTTPRAGGKASGFIRAKAGELHGFGTLMQTADAGAFRGKRVRLSGYVKSQDVLSGWSGMWLRIDGSRGEMLGFDNMQSRPIKGTTDWTRYEVVLDVPNEAAALAFGVLLGGNGHVWLDDLAFEVVAPTVPTTGVGPAEPPGPPRNLDFEN